MPPIPSGWQLLPIQPKFPIGWKHMDLLPIGWEADWPQTTPPGEQDVVEQVVGEQVDQEQAAVDSGSETSWDI